MRVPLLSDSEVSVAVRAKGRSASRQLNREARRQLPHLVGGELYPAPVWGPTQLQPADAPTRRRSLVRWRRDARSSGLGQGSPCDLVGDGPRDRAPLDLCTDNVEAESRRRYAVQLARFDGWLARGGHPTVEGLATALRWRELDGLVVSYLQVLYDEDWPQGHGHDLASGLQWRNNCSRVELRGCWRALTAWEVAEPGDFRTPLPLDILLALVAAALGLRQGGLAAILLLMFHCLLRPGEAAALRIGDILLPSQRLGRPIGIVAVRRPKVRGARGPRLQSVLIEDQRLLAWLEWLTDGRAPSTPLLLGGYPALLKQWTILSGMVGLERGRYTPACCRAGGATFDYLERGDLGDLLRRGRWANTSTLDHYVQLAMAELTLRALPAETVARCRRLAALVGALLKPEGDANRLWPAPEPRRRRLVLAT